MSGPTDAEVKALLAGENVSEQALRKIATHTELTKRYAVVLALIKNPRTPAGIALGLYPRLSPRDMKALAGVIPGTGWIGRKYHA